ncbi:MAG: hypothetical protein NW237_12660 [Cyanobacteriota bacterium]|nr:hypothetical protein [Cyanobacteriota bacterium]
MRSTTPKTYSFALAGWGFWLTTGVVVLLLTVLGWGWLVAALVGLLVFLLSLPILLLLAFRWWMGRLIATAACPVCHFESQAVEGSRFFCPNCHEPLFVADATFYRQTPKGTIEVELIED